MNLMDLMDLMKQKEEMPGYTALETNIWAVIAQLCMSLALNFLT